MLRVDASPDRSENSRMTEAEDWEAVVTPEMIAAGDAPCRILELSYRDCYDAAEDGLRVAFPRMLKVWLQQGAPMRSPPSLTQEAELSPRDATVLVAEDRQGR